MDFNCCMLNFVEKYFNMGNGVRDIDHKPMSGRCREGKILKFLEISSPIRLIRYRPLILQYCYSYCYMYLTIQSLSRTLQLRLHHRSLPSYPTFLYLSPFLCDLIVFLYYRVFIRGTSKNCVFYEDFKTYSLGVSVCTHTSAAAELAEFRI